jgi:hypothetical protein
VSAAASASAVCFDIIAALHEYFDQTGYIYEKMEPPAGLEPATC